MYVLNDEYIAPAELTGYARAALADQPINRFRLRSWLPDVNISDLDYRFTSGGQGLTEAATFRTYDTPSPFGARQGAQQVTGQLPPISRQIRLGEYERLRMRQAANDAVVEAIYNDAENMVRAVAARMELARGQALVTGTVVINENGVQATADFGRDSGNTVTAATLWSTVATATVLSDLITWSDAYLTLNGVRPAAILTSTAVARLMQRNAEVIDAIAGNQTGRTRVTAAELNDLLQSEGLPAVETYDAQVTVAGTTTRIVGANQLLLLPSPGSPDDSDLGATLWGTTAESMEPGYAMEAGEEPGIVAGVYKSDNPVALYTNAAGIGLPVLANPNLSFAATVS